MKIFRTLMMICGIALLFTSCEKTDVDPAGARNEAAVPGIKNLNPATFDVNDLENTYVQFDLTSDATGVEEAILLVSYNKGGERKEVQKVNSFPANITIKLTEVVSVLGMDLNSVEAADVFNFEVQTIEGGKTYFSSAAFNVAVVCGYEVENVTGAYRAVSSPDQWDHEGNVTLAADPDDEYTVYITGLAASEGVDEDGDPIALHIDPLDFSVTAPRATVASSMEPLAGYTGYSYEGSGSLNTCDGTYTMMFEITVDQGSFGSFEFVFTKR